MWYGQVQEFDVYNAWGVSDLKVEWWNQAAGLGKWFLLLDIQSNDVFGLVWFGLIWERERDCY